MEKEARPQVCPSEQTNYCYPVTRCRSHGLFHLATSSAATGTTALPRYGSWTCCAWTGPVPGPWRSGTETERGGYPLPFRCVSMYTDCQEPQSGGEAILKPTCDPAHLHRVTLAGHVTLFWRFLRSNTCRLRLFRGQPSNIAMGSVQGRVSGPPARGQLPVASSCCFETF